MSIDVGDREYGAAHVGLNLIGFSGLFCLPNKAICKRWWRSVRRKKAMVEGVGVNYVVLDFNDAKPPTKVLVTRSLFIENSGANLLFLRYKPVTRPCSQEKKVSPG